MTDQQESLERPKNVVLATALLWISLAISVLNLVIYWDTIIATAAEAVAKLPNEFPMSLPTFFTIVYTLTFVIISWMYIKIYTGRNWARILFAVFTVIGLPLSLPQLYHGLFAIDVRFLFHVMAWICNIEALFLLFTASSSAWFMALKAQRKLSKS